MRRFARWIGLVGIVGGIAGSAAPAHALALLLDNRHVDSYYDPGTNAGGEPIQELLYAPAWAPFDAVARLATQSSQMDLADGGLTMLWTAEGSARHVVDVEGIGLDPSGSGHSHFGFSFRVDGEATVHLGGFLDLDGDLDAYGNLVNVETHAELVEIWRSGRFAFDLVLPPGDYALRVTADPYPHGYGGHSGFTVDFSVTDTLRPIPEPSTALLVGLGVGAAAASTRRRS
jgi:hypothetical protein